MLSPALLQSSCLGVNMYLRPANTPCAYIDGRQFSDRAISTGGLKDFLVGTCGRYLTHYGLRPRVKQQAQELGLETLVNASLLEDRPLGLDPPGSEHGRSQVCRDQRLCLASSETVFATDSSSRHARGSHLARGSSQIYTPPCGSFLP